MYFKLTLLVTLLATLSSCQRSTTNVRMKMDSNGNVKFSGSGKTAQVFQPFYAEGEITKGGEVVLSTSTGADSFMVDSSLGFNIDDVSSPGADLKIACSAAPSTGSTCSGNESVGFSFEAPARGVYRVCMSFSVKVRTDGGSEMLISRYILNHVTNDSSESTLKGSQEHYGHWGNGSLVDRWNQGIPFTICGGWELPAGKNTFKQKYRVRSTNGSVAEHRVFVSNSDNHIAKFSIHRIR